MRNWWDLRHRLILERLTAALLTANVGVLMEPGPLDPRYVYAQRHPQPPPPLASSLKLLSRSRSLFAPPSLSVSISITRCL